MGWFVLKPWLMNQLATSIQSIISVPTLSTQTNATPANQLVVLLVQSVPVVGLASRVINYCCKPVVQSSKVPMIRSSWEKLVKVLLLWGIKSLFLDNSDDWWKVYNGAGSCSSSSTSRVLTLCILQ